MLLKLIIFAIELCVIAGPELVYAVNPDGGKDPSIPNLTTIHFLLAQ